jgi:hypothetical protein
VAPPPAHPVQDGSAGECLNDIISICVLYVRACSGADCAYVASVTANEFARWAERGLFKSGARVAAIRNAREHAAPQASQTTESDYLPKNWPGSGPNEPSGNRRLGNGCTGIPSCSCHFCQASRVNSPAGAFSSTLRNSSAGTYFPVTATSADEP